MTASFRYLGVASVIAVALPASASAQRADPNRIIDFHLNAERPNVSSTAR